ncbi:MAG: AAA family ATPase, partial [Spirulinaceae cyanobacterium]
VTLYFLLPFAYFDLQVHTANLMTKNLLKSFSIYGLFGTKDVHIPFDEDIKILIGENGLGKTQVLNIFYYTLTKDFLKLDDFPFERIELSFGKETIKITKEDIREIISKNENIPTELEEWFTQFVKSERTKEKIGKSTPSEDKNVFNVNVSVGKKQGKKSTPHLEDCAELTKRYLRKAKRN